MTTIDVNNAKSFPFYRLKGTHREIGQQFGNFCFALIQKHRDNAVRRIQSIFDVSVEQILEAALLYRPFVQHYSRFLDEEIQGVAEGSKISLGEAYLLQLRAELTTNFGSPLSHLILENECTTFGLLPEVTADQQPLTGQNADLPVFYREIGVVVEIIAKDKPAVLMLTPAGQVSYIGMNDRGLGTFANYLRCEGWRVGFPRYLLTRLALTQGSVEEAIPLLQTVQRASSRNLLLLDKNGSATDIETTPYRDARLHPNNGILVHSNHYISEELLDEERSSGVLLRNSQIRYSRIRELLSAQSGHIDALTMQAILRDRETYPDSLCKMENDTSDDTITFASVISEPAKGQMWVAVGPPNKNPYKCYVFSKDDY